MDARLHYDLVDNGVVPVAVVGLGEEFTILRLDRELNPAAMKDAQCKGFYFVGVMAVVDGRPIARCNPGLESVRVMMNAAFEYSRLVADHLKAQQAGDEAEWLERLYALPDTRTEL